MKWVRLGFLTLIFTKFFGINNFGNQTPTVICTQSTIKIYFHLLLFFLQSNKLMTRGKSKASKCNCNKQPFSDILMTFFCPSINNIPSLIRRPKVARRSFISDKKDSNKNVGTKNKIRFFTQKKILTEGFSSH